MSQASGKWETVKPKKELKAKASGKDGKGKPTKADVLDPAQQAFAALDSNWQQQVADASRSGPAIAPAEATPSTAGQYASLQTHTPPASPQQPPPVVANEPAPQPKKPKAPKKPRVTVADTIEQLKPQVFQQFVQQVEQRYPEDQRSQLETLTDYLLNTFKECDLPFNKLVLDQPLDKAAEIPVQSVPQSISDLSSSFFAGMDVNTLASFALVLINTVFEQVPESMSSKAALPKAKVGVLLALALLLRAAPISLLPIFGDLQQRGRFYTSPGRLPFLLWVLSQASWADAGVGVAAWAHILLPQILGAELATTSSKAATSTAATNGGENGHAVHKLSATGALSAMEYLESTLDRHAGSLPGGPQPLDARKAAERGYKYSVGTESKTIQVHEPVVPPGALELLVRALYTPAFQLSPDVRTRLRKRYDQLRMLAFAGIPDGGFNASEGIKLALDTTAASDASSSDDGLVAEAARNIVSCLSGNTGSAAAWESRHKHQLRGSTRILQHLAANPKLLQPCLVDVPRRMGFLAMVKTLQQRHRFHLQSGKGWQGASARAADEACTQLAGRAGGRSGAGLLCGGLASAALLAAILGVTAVAMSQSPRIQELVHEVAQSEAFQAASAPLHGAAAKLAPYADDLGVKLRPYVADVSARLAPYWHQASEQAMLVAHSVHEQAAPILDGISSQLAALLPRSGSH